MQSPWTLREAETKKGRCSVSGNGPLTFPRQLDVVADAANVARHALQGLVFRKCGEKLKTAEHNPIFGNKTAGRGNTKPGPGRQFSVFPALPEAPAGSMRQIPEPPSTPPLSHKETAGRCVGATWRGRPVLILPHTSGFSHRCGRSTVKTIRLTRLSRLIISRFRNNL